jgi:hypothetical protein
MKTKSLILGLVAFVFATGSAFTYVSSPLVNAWIKVRYDGEPGYTCRATSLQCTDVGTHACKVTVADINLATNAFTDTNCNVKLKSASVGSIGTFDPAQEIIQAPTYVDQLP